MPWHYLFISFSLLLYAGIAGPEASKQAWQRQLHVILLTVESLRAGMVSSEPGPGLLQAAKTACILQDDRAVSGWTGSRTAMCQLGYRSGRGAKPLKGVFDIDCHCKDFGIISRRCWNTWLVLQSPFAFRARQEGGSWSRWIRLEAVS